MESKTAGKGLPPHLSSQLLAGSFIFFPLGALLVWILVQEQDPISLLTKDVNAVAGVPIRAGILSQVGLLLWAGTAAVCFLGVWVTARKTNERLLFSLGLLATSMLLADDMLQIHEGFGPWIGVPEVAFYIVYGLVVLVMLASCRTSILRSPYGWLVAALLFLGVSVGIDAVDIPGIEVGSPLYFFLEDGAKALGIGGWFTFFTFTLRRHIRSVSEPILSEEAPAALEREVISAGRRN